MLIQGKFILTGCNAMTSLSKEKDCQMWSNKVMNTLEKRFSEPANNIKTIKLLITCQFSNHNILSILSNEGSHAYVWE